MKTITVKGAEFQIPTAEEAGLVAGYVLDAAAAKHLYQTWCDRIRNNVSPVVKKSWTTAKHRRRSASGLGIRPKLPVLDARTAWPHLRSCC